MPKINWKKIIMFGFWILVFGILIYTRFVNLGWGLPYPIHPDERNMATAVQQLHCEFSIRQLADQISNCLNPHFFAYGQFPLYFGYGGVLFIKFLAGRLGTSISFQEAVFSLRMISAVASIITAFIFYKVLLLLLPKKVINYKLQVISFLVLIFSPVLIQFAHFGTTETLLILFYSLIMYFSLLFLQKKLNPIPYTLFTSLFCGLALATKISSAIYLITPFIVIFDRIKKKFSVQTGLFLLLTFIFFILFSPHTIISFKEFIASMQYESGLALGQPEVFYTRQFDHTVPIIFQITKIFPYSLGWPVFILGILGMLISSWKKKEFNLLRLSFFLTFLPNAFMYAKWTRFIAPAFPLMIIFSILFLSKIQISRFVLYIIAFIMLIPGIAYLSVYQNKDVRFQATDWIYKNINRGARILSETANVVDVPLENNRYGLISFNFYDLDADKHLQEDLENLIPSAGYIIVPSRRIFKNHPQEKYPLLNKYYRSLFSGTLGFKRIAEFTSYPQLKFQIFNFKFKMDFPDEDAEETWTVFDHPVIRIYKKEPTFFR